MERLFGWENCGDDMLAALRAAWQSRSETEWLRDAPETYQQIVAAISKAERATAVGGSADFLRKRFGKNWVLARRSSNIVARYGSDVVCLSPKQYAQAEDDYLNGVKA